MRAILIALLAVFGSCKTATKAGPPVNADGLAITMSFVSGENSKDSNSQSYSVSVNGESVSYSGPHPPCERGRCAHGKVDFALDKKLYDEAVAAFTRGDLTDDFSEKMETSGSGNYVKVEARITVGDKTATTSVVGMTSSWVDDAVILSEKARARAEAVRMVLIPFRLAGEERLPKK